MGSMAGLAICQYEGEDSFYLFGCDKDWQTITDSWHQTLAEAKRQAEFEYECIGKTWVEIVEDYAGLRMKSLTSPHSTRHQ